MTEREKSIARSAERSGRYGGIGLVFIVLGAQGLWGNDPVVESNDAALTFLLIGMGLSLLSIVTDWQGSKKWR